jgi:hypothetical protein
MFGVYFLISRNRTLKIKLPSNCIVFDRAVKAVESEDGGTAVFVYNPKKDESVREAAMLEYALG